MTAREQFSKGWGGVWHIIGGILGGITQIAGIGALAITLMGVTLYFHEIMITNECVDTNKIALINNDYTIECTATPVVSQEEDES